MQDPVKLHTLDDVVTGGNREGLATLRCRGVRSSLADVQDVVGVGPERPVDLSVGGFLWPALRTGRATFTASGSPRTHTTDIGCRLPVQLVLGPQYPRLGVNQRRPGARCSPATSWHPHRSLLIRCPPSPCGRLSRPPTTTRAPPHPGLISRRRTCPPQRWTGGGEGDPAMVHPRSPSTGRQGRCPALLLQPRHGYAAGLPRDLPTDIRNRLRSRSPTGGGRALLTGPHPPGSV